MKYVDTMEELVAGDHYHLGHWPFSKKTGAITFGSIVLHRDPKPTAKIIRHEEGHVASNHGKTALGADKNMIQWYLSYLWEWVRKGYYNSKYEREARAREKGRGE